MEILHTYNGAKDFIKTFSLHDFNDRVIPRALAPSKPIDAAEIYKQIQSSWQLFEQQDLSPAQTANQWPAFNSDSQHYDIYTIFMLNAQENVSNFSFVFSNK